MKYLESNILIFLNHLFIFPLQAFKWIHDQTKTWIYFLNRIFKL